MFVLVLLLVLLFFILYPCYLYFRKCHGIKNIPQLPTHSAIFGNGLQIKSSTKLLPYGMEMFLKYGLTFRIRFLHLPIVITQDKDLIKAILGSNILLTKSNTYKFVKSWIGDGLLTATGDKWRHDRNILTPAFHIAILKQFISVFEKVGNGLVTKFDSLCGTSSFDVFPIFSLSALDVICETAMGVEMKTLNGQNHNYVKIVKEICQFFVNRGLSGYKIFDCIYKLTPDYIKEKEFLKILHDFTRNVIKNRSMEMLKPDGKLALLDLLLKYSQNGKLFDIQNQIDTFMFAGFDTTSTVLSFILYCLSQNVNAQELAYQEQLSLFGHEKNPEISYANLQDMKYLELVIKETLRLYPPVPIIGRRLDEDLIFKHHTIQKNTDLIIFVYGIHRNPEFYPNPEQFNPERFKNFEPPPFTYLAFSAGSRNCIGQKFAMLEMKSTIGKIIRNFQILPAFPEQKPVLATNLVLSSTTGVQIALKKRI